MCTGRLKDLGRGLKDILADEPTTSQRQRQYRYEYV